MKLNGKFLSPLIILITDRNFPSSSHLWDWTEASKILGKAKSAAPPSQPNNLIRSFKLIESLYLVIGLLDSARLIACFESHSRTTRSWWFSGSEAPWYFGSRVGMSFEFWWVMRSRFAMGVRDCVSLSRVYGRDNISFDFGRHVMATMRRCASALRCELTLSRHVARRLLPGVHFSLPAFRTGTVSLPGFSHPQNARRCQRWPLLFSRDYAPEIIFFYHQVNRFTWRKKTWLNLNGIWSIGTD